MRIGTPRTGLGLLMVGALAASIGGAAMSLALFTDTETVDGTFSSGTIVLDAIKIDALTFSAGTMLPGDTKVGSVVVENDGSAQLRYAVSHASTNADTKDLRSQLTLAIRTEDIGAGAFGTDGDYCDDASGTSLLAATALGASGNAIGDPATGAQGGERTLAAAANEVLCFYVALPSATGNAYQGATTTTTFTFTAEQTANN